MFQQHVDILRSLMWQYDETSALRSLAQSKQDWYSTQIAGFWSDWFRDVFDLRTANSFGLAVWAIVLDLPLAFDVEATVSKPFGFDPFGNNLDISNFGTDAPTALPLTVEQRRLALRLRFYQLTSDGCAPSINAFLKTLFPQGRAYVLDGLDMTCAYVFEFVLDPSILRVLTDFDLLPRPAGVEVRVLTTGAGDFFGFADFGRPFDLSNFKPEVST